MDFISFSILSGFLTALIWNIFFKKRKHLKIPGPYGLPIIGFLVHFVKGVNYQQKLIDLKEKYGSICKVQMGSFTCIFLNDQKLIREAWSNPIFCGRPQVPGVLARTHGVSGGINFNEGDDFTEQKRFTIKHLKDFGFGHKSMERLILDEAVKLIDSIEKSAGIPLTTRNLFNIASFNILFSITTGTTYRHDDPELCEMTETLNRNLELNDGAKVAFFLPWLARLFPKLIGWKSYIKDANFIFDFWKRFADAAISRIPPGNEASNFTEFYVQKIKSCTNINSSFYGKKGEMSLAFVLQDLFIVGTETTSTTLSWAFLFLATFKEVQEKVKNEILSVIGKEEMPSLTNRQSMVYTEAFLMETMRFGTLAPLGIVHSTMENVMFHGYFIPKNTIVQANICAVHNDADVWGDPKNFRPERFLTDDGKKLKHCDGFLAFSCGKRVCPGEALAKNELFIFVTSILQKFCVDYDYSEAIPSLEPIIGVSAIPVPHKLIFSF